MKKISQLILFLFFACGLSAQTPSTLYTVPGIDVLQSYSGRADRVHVTADNADYILCPTCTVDNSSVYAGTDGKKWLRIIDNTAYHSITQSPDSTQAKFLKSPGKGTVIKFVGGDGTVSAGGEGAGGITPSELSDSLNNVTLQRAFNNSIINGDYPTIDGQSNNFQENYKKLDIIEYIRDFFNPTTYMLAGNHVVTEGSDTLFAFNTQSDIHNDSAIAFLLKDSFNYYYPSITYSFNEATATSVHVDGGRFTTSDPAIIFISNFLSNGGTVELDITTPVTKLSNTTLYRDPYVVYAKNLNSQFSIQDNNFMFSNNGGSDTSKIILENIPISTDPSYLISIENDTLKKVAYPSGGNSTWEQTLINQGSAPFTNDNTVDFGGHSFELDNLGSFNLYLSNGASLQSTESGLDLEYDDDSTHSGVNSFLNTSEGGAIVSLGAKNDNINNGTGVDITPKRIHIFNQRDSLLKLQIDNLDSSNANPNNIAWFDSNNILHRGSISTSGGSGGITQAQLNDSLDAIRNSAHWIPLEGTLPGKPVTGRIELAPNELDYLFYIEGLNGGQVDLISYEGEDLTLDVGNGAGLGSGWNIAPSYMNFSLFSNGQYISKLDLYKKFLRVDFKDPTSTGMGGMQNYSANIQPLDYTQKVYVDSLNARKQNKLTVTNTGNSGPAQMIGDVLNIPNYLNGWGLTGTSGTTSANFIGTVDNNPLRIKVNNTLAGYIGSLTNANVSLGYISMPESATGTKNSAVGTGALGKNTTGFNNSATGYTTLYNNTVGNENTANGWASQGYDSAGLGNTSMGNQSLNNVTGDVSVHKGGSYNSAFGYGALAGNHENKFNIGLGYFAGKSAKDSGTLYISDSTTHLKMKLDSSFEAAPSVVGKDANGYWHVYQTPSGGGGSQVNSDWNANSGAAQILNKPSVYIKSEVDAFLVTKQDKITVTTTGTGAAQLTGTTLNIPTNGVTTLTTFGTSGAASFTSNTLNIPIYKDIIYRGIDSIRNGVGFAGFSAGYYIFTVTTGGISSCGINLNAGTTDGMVIDIYFTDSVATINYPVLVPVNPITSIGKGGHIRYIYDSSRSTWFCFP